MSERRSSDGGRKRGAPSSEDNDYDGSKRVKGVGGLGSVVAKHYNELEEKGLEAREESQIFHMRSFNNWIKSMLISKQSITYIKSREIWILN